MSTRDDALRARLGQSEWIVCSEALRILDSTLCQRRDDGQVCILIADHEGRHEMRSDTTTTPLQAVEDFAESLAQEAERYADDGETGDGTAEWVRDRFADWRKRHTVGVETTGQRAVCAPGCDHPVTGYHAKRGGRVLCHPPADTDTGRGQ